jgi:hypothetical protein
MWVLGFIVKALISFFAHPFGWSINGRDVRIGYELGLAFLMCLLACVVFILGLTGVLTFCPDKYSDSVARAGAVMTILLVFGKHRLDSIAAEFSHWNNSSASQELNKMILELRVVVKRCNVFITSVLILSALLWGYGDVVVLRYFEGFSKAVGCY